MRAILCVLAGGRSLRFGVSKLRVRVGGVRELPEAEARAGIPEVKIPGTGLPGTGAALLGTGLPGAGLPGGEPVVSWMVRRLRSGWAAEGRAEAWLSVAPGQAAVPSSVTFDRVVIDAAAFAGPLSGMMQVLQAAGEDDVVAFVPADMPALEAVQLRRLAERLRAGPAVWGADLPEGELLEADVPEGGLPAGDPPGGDHPRAELPRAELPGAELPGAQLPGEVGVMGRWVSGPRAGRVEPLPSLWRAGAGRRLLAKAMVAGVHSPSRLADWPGVATIDLDGPADQTAYLNLNRQSDLPTLQAALGRELTIG